MMLDRFMLPFDTSPMVETYFNVAYVYAIASAHIDPRDHLAWISEKYINCLYAAESADQKLYTAIWDHTSEKKGLMRYQKMDLPKDIFPLIHLDFIALTKRSLLAGVYPNFRLRWRYILPEGDPRLMERVQESVIIGWDEDKRVFILKRSSPDFHLCTYEIGYDVFEAAVRDVPDEAVVVHFWEYIGTDRLEVDFNEIRVGLTDYLASQNSKMADPKRIPYGVAAIRRWLEDCAVRVQAGGRLEEHYFRVLKEHKDLMSLRMQFLSSKGIVNGDIVNQAKENQELAARTARLAMEMSENRTTELFQMIRQSVETILENEIRFLPSVIASLAEIHVS